MKPNLFAPTDRSLSAVSDADSVTCDRDDHRFSLVRRLSPTRFVGGSDTDLWRTAGPVRLALVAAVLLLIPHNGPRCAVSMSRACLTPTPHQPGLSLVLVTLDTTRADRIGAYGDPRAATTPALDRLAREGVLFEDATSPAPLTLPAHCTLFTGRLPPSHGVHENVGVLDDAAPTLATVLRARGYRTAAFVGSRILARSHGLSRGFEVYDDAIPFVPGSPRLRSRRRANAVVDRALGWIAGVKDARFFAWVHVYDAHAPYDSTPPFERQHPGRPYEAAIAAVDAQIGRLRAYLDRNRLTARTVIVIVGDHGEGLGDHGELTHGLFVYQSVLRVPFIIRAPFGALQGRRVKSPVSSADVMPTVLDLLVADPAGGVEGRSLVPVVLQPGRVTAADVYAENVYVRRRFGWSEMHAIRSGAFKLIAKTTPELYDLDRDPGETRDLSAERPALVRRMARRLRAWHDRLQATGTAAEAPDTVSADERRRLASLGYIGALPRGVHAGRVGADPRDHVDLFNRLAVPSRAAFPGSR
jgi:sulfatase-like protein